jgi:predicted RNase H-like HicB family nuclease
MRYPVVIARDPEDGGFVSQCPSIPGCVSEGDTVENALVGIRDAIEGCLTVMREHGDPIPPSVDVLLTTVEVSA